MITGHILSVENIPRYNDLEISDIGRIQLGEVHGSRVYVSYTLKEYVESVSFAIYRSDGSIDLTDITERRQIGIVINKAIPFELKYNIIGMAVIAFYNGKVFALNHDKYKSFLDRLFADDLDKVDKYIRWGDTVLGPRIADLDTCFFAALNSINQVSGDFIHHCRCLVSFSYRAVEDSHDDKIEWAVEFCRSHLTEFSSCKNADVRASILCAWIHLAIYRLDIEEIYRINRLLYETCKDINRKDGNAIYNIFQCKILVGGMFLNAGDYSRAKEIFEDFDQLFRIAVESFPRNWINNFRELDLISKSMLVCATALDMCKGKRTYLEYEIPEVSIEYAWNQGNRLRSQAARDLIREKYFRLVDIHAENLKSEGGAK